MLIYGCFTMFLLLDKLLLFHPHRARENQHQELSAQELRLAAQPAVGWRERGYGGVLRQARIGMKN